VDIHVIRYTPDAYQRNNENDKSSKNTSVNIVSDIFSLTIYQSHSVDPISVNNLNHQSIIEIPMDSAPNSEAYCGFFKETTRLWSTEGGNTISTFGSVAQCAWTHFTDFAILNHQLDNHAVIAPITYSVYAGVYAALIFSIVFQFGRMTYYRKCSHLTYPMMHHTLALIIALFRMALALQYSGRLDVVNSSLNTNIFIAVCSAVPYMVMFWMFSLLIFQWADIVHYAMRSGSRGAKTLRPFFLILNIMLSITICTLFLLLALYESRRTAIALVGSIFMSVVTSGTSIGFFDLRSYIIACITERATKDIGKKIVSCFYYV